MPNKFTRIPGGSPPPLPAAAAPLVMLADAFMLLMVSRPATGSLRTTWVTPATFWMGLAIGVAGGVGGALAIARGTADSRTGLVVAGVAVLVLAAGSGAVAMIGAIQRRGHQGLG